MFMASSGAGASPGFTSVPRAIMFIVASAGPFAGSLGFVLMCGEKLGSQLVHLSLTDPLTIIPNRRAYLESLEHALSSASRHSESVAMLVIDVDPDLIVIPARLTDELRFLIVGIINEKHWSGVITYRENTIRIISVRRSRPEEVALRSRLVCPRRLTLPPSLRRGPAPTQKIPRAPCAPAP
jgi:uncharacterized DUF497 family protein